jgi:hypothetical protein
MTPNRIHRTLVATSLALTILGCGAYMYVISVVTKPYVLKYMRWRDNTPWEVNEDGRMFVMCGPQLPPHSAGATLCTANDNLRRALGREPTDGEVIEELNRVRFGSRRAPLW